MEVVIAVLLTEHELFCPRAEAITLRGAEPRLLLELEDKEGYVCAEAQNCIPSAADQYVHSSSLELS